MDSHKFCYYDDRYIYVITGIATTEQLAANIDQALKEGSQKLGRKLETEYRINLVLGSGGCKVGYAYVWFSNKRIVNMFLGRKADGSENVEYLDDPNWKAPQRCSSTPNFDFDSFDAIQRDVSEPCLSPRKLNASWADLAEEENDFVCPKIKKILEPILTLKGFKYTEAQKKELKSISDKMKIVKNNSFDEGAFLIERVYVEEIPDNQCGHVLYATNIPDWLSEKTLKKHFEVYASDPVTIHERITRNKKGEQKSQKDIERDTFPYVNITKNRVAFITFDGKTRDAQFARLMTRKLTFESSDKRCTLFFSHTLLRDPKDSKDKKDYKDRKEPLK